MSASVRPAAFSQPRYVAGCIQSTPCACVHSMKILTALNNFAVRSLSEVRGPG